MEEQESLNDIMNNSVRAIFTYGTLRADFSLKGDRWGVLEHFNNLGFPCVWCHGEVLDFSLYQNPLLQYPFAMPVKKGRIKGTLLSWPTGESEQIFAKALQQCNKIECFSPSGKGLYDRKIVPVITENGTTNAYLYFQSNSEDIACCKSFPSGNWLENRTSS